MRLLWFSTLLLLSAPTHSFYVFPGYMPDDGPAENSFAGALAVLAVSGLANRDHPTLWLNASASSWVRPDIPVNWPYPEADATWLLYWEKKLQQRIQVLPNRSLCGLVQIPEVAAVVKGVVVYEDSTEIDALRWIATTAAGMYDGIPVTAAIRSECPCLQSLPVVFKVPTADTFDADLDAYEWMVDHLLPLMSVQPTVLVGACRSWTNYSCAWNDPLGAAAIDYSIAQKGIVVNLAASDEEQGHMLSRIANVLPAFGLVTGWMEPEDVMVELLSENGLVVLCGAPNLPFFASHKPSNLKLPTHRSTDNTFNATKTYVVFQSNEGDTPKNAYSFRGGQWLDSKRGTVPIAWGSSPLIAEHFPGLWEYYVETATSADSFFAATGAVGYTHPWGVRNITEFGAKAGELIELYMPETDNWVDVWEGGCPNIPWTMAANPCAALYQEFRDASGGRIAGFSQQPTSALTQSFPKFVEQTWTTDGTPIIEQPLALWYPNRGNDCNDTLCVENLIMEVLPGPARFVLTYGVVDYVSVASAVQKNLAKAGVVVIGAQDLAALAWQQGPRFRAP